MKILAFIADPPVLSAILLHLDLPARVAWGAPTALRPSRPLAGRLSGTSCSIRHRASTPPTPTPRPTTLRAVPSSSTSPCPPTSTTDSGALHTPSLVLGPRRPSAHGLGPSDHPAVLSPSRPFTLPSRRRESSPRASPEPAAYHPAQANRAVGLSFPCSHPARPAPSGPARSRRPDAVAPTTTGPGIRVGDDQTPGRRHDRCLEDVVRQLERLAGGRVAHTLVPDRGHGVDGRDQVSPPPSEMLTPTDLTVRLCCVYTAYKRPDVGSTTICGAPMRSRSTAGVVGSTGLQLVPPSRERAKPNRP